MKRVAFEMTLKPGCAGEYIKRHQQVWPALLELLKQSGVSDYSIFLDEKNNRLIGVQRCTPDGGSQEMGNHPIVREWWSHMSDIMETNPDLSPVSRPLQEVFYME